MRARRCGGTAASSAAGRCGRTKVFGSERAQRVFRLLEDVGAEAGQAIEADAEALGAWLGETKVTPRFATPLAKELMG